ncbi:hypothetical protein FOZ62_008991, partial [Perkinsus olseni]
FAIQQAITRVTERNEGMTSACLNVCRKSDGNPSLISKTMALSLPAAVAAASITAMSPSKRSILLDRSERSDDGSPFRTRQHGDDLSPAPAVASGCRCVSCVAQEQLVRAEESHQSEVHHLHEELDALRRGVADRDKRIHEMSEHHAEQLSRQVAATDKRLSEASTRYEGELEAIKGQTIGLQKELTNSKERCGELMKELESARKDLRTAETEKQKHQHAREQLDRELVDKHQQLMERAAELADARRRLGDELSQLKAELGRERQSIH